MPKGEIVGMFTGRVCLSLMERTTTMWHVYRQSVLVIDGKIRVCIDGKTRNNVSSGEEENSMQRSKLRRDSILRCADRSHTSRLRNRRIKGHGL
jgi:hypothetical protein